MRLTPSQGAMLQLLGQKVFREPSSRLKDRIAYGRRLLVQFTGQDFGFDLQKWHDYLQQSDAGGYRWSNKHLAMPNLVRQTESDPCWLGAVQQLESGENDEDKNSTMG